MFELYATGSYSLSSLQKAIKAEFGQRMAKGYLERLLKNPFYAGLFIWEGKTYTGTHIALISGDQFERVQMVFRGHNKPKYQKHEFAFRGLLTCSLRLKRPNYSKWCFRTAPSTPQVSIPHIESPST
jgi:site-specific DNA recombinase